MNCGKQKNLVNLIKVENRFKSNSIRISLKNDTESPFNKRGSGMVQRKKFAGKVSFPFL